MGLSLTAYIESLDERADLIWPKPAPIVPMKATPFLAPLPGIKLVTWEVYGTLLMIDQGQLLFDHQQELRMQIALDKTIKEFNMWYSMSRKPGQPWEYMLRQYRGILEDLQMVSVKKGEIPEIDAIKLWRKILGRLEQNEYSYDIDRYGDLDDLAQKVAFFFHTNLQGVTAGPHVRDTLTQLTAVGIQNSLLADGQMFTLPVLLHELRQQGSVSGISSVLAADHSLLSYQCGVKKPSRSFFMTFIEQLKAHRLSPEQVLHVSHRLDEDLAIAKQFGMRTALLVQDKQTCQVQAADVRDPEKKPDRLVTDVRQILEILQR